MVLAERLKQELVNRRIVMKRNGIRERIIESVEEILKETKSRMKMEEGRVKNKEKFWDDKERKCMSEKKCPLSPILCNIIS